MGNTANTSEFSIQVRVYIEDTDAAGIVYYVNYLKYMERARSDWLREQEASQQCLRDEGIQFVVKQCVIDYHKPAQLDDDLTVTVHISQLARASVTFTQTVYRKEELLCRGEVKLACVNKKTLKPRRLPTQFPCFTNQLREPLND